MISGSGDSPDLGNLTAYPFVVTQSPTTTVTSSVNPQITGSNVTFTATVVAMPLGATGPTGTVSFFDGTTLLGTGTLNHVSASYIAMLTTASLSIGAHIIKATYPGNTAYVGSSGTFTQTIVRRPNHIVASGGGGQTTVYGTPFANPLVVTVTDETGAGVPERNRDLHRPWIKLCSSDGNNQCERSGPGNGEPDDDRIAYGDGQRDRRKRTSYLLFDRDPSGADG